VFKVALVGYDGERFNHPYDRQVLISQSVQKINGEIVVSNEDVILVPDSSIFRYTFTPLPDDEFITISVSFKIFNFFCVTFYSFKTQY